MTIGINGNDANDAHRVGVGQYAFGLLTALAKLPTDDAEYRIYLQHPPLSDLPQPDTHWHYQVLSGRGLWTLTTLQKQLLLYRDKPNVFFTPSHYAPLVMSMPSVIGIMDMSFERFPQYFNKKDLYQLKYWTRFSASQAKKILTISQFSKDEICKLYNFPSTKVTVAYPGYDNQRFRPREVKAENYLLYLGTLQPKKNLVRLIEAFSTLPDKKLQLKVVGMINEGRGGWMYQEIFAKVKTLGLEKRVIFTGYVPDDQISQLIAAARAYVLPSLYEGFGIPAIEAMATGVPVVVSKVASLPEVCGQAAIYIDDPYSVSSIKLALEEVLSLSNAERQKRVNFGLEWVTRYNWENTAERTLEVLKSVAGNHED